MLGVSICVSKAQFFFLFASVISQSLLMLHTELPSNRLFYSP